MGLMKPLLLSSLLLASVAWADRTVDYEFTYGGKAIGTSRTTWGDKGAFTSVGGWKIGPQEVHGDISGVLGKVSTFLAKLEGQGKKVTLKYAAKKITVTQDGKSSDVPVAEEPALLFSNTTPATLRAIPDLISAGKSKVKMMIVDAGALLDAELSKAAPIMFQGQEVSQYTLKFAGLSISVAVDPKTGDAVGMYVPAQKFGAHAKGFENVFVDPVDKYTELSASTHKPLITRGVKMTTRDGATLVMDIARPAEEGKYPVILQRTPYGRALSFFDGEWWAKRGYVYIAQDVRGKSDSTGEWDPFMNERRDGKDTLDWIVAQPWSDGKVGMIGASYAGMVQWQAAAELHPALKCIIPQVSPPDPMRNIPYYNGAPFLASSLWWANIVKSKVADMTQVSAKPDYSKMLVMPITKADDQFFGKNIPFVDKWWSRYRYSDWNGANFNADMPKINIPALMISGWWDGDAIGTRLNWEIMRTQSKPNQWLLYGPWAHGFNAATKFADVEYGPSSLLELNSVYLRWFDTWLKGKEVGLEKMPKARWFVTGANKWQSGSGWPSPEAKPVTYHLAKGGKLAAKPGSGSFAVVFDPNEAKEAIKKTAKNDIVPSTKVKLDLKSKTEAVLMTEAFTSDTTLGGPCSLNIEFSSSVRDCDFAVLLVDVDAKGVARFINLPGILRTSYRDMMNGPKPLTPGKKTTCTVVMNDFAHQFKKGHKLGIVVACGGFPNISQNPGTGEPPAVAKKVLKSVQTIYPGSTFNLYRLPNP